MNNGKVLALLKENGRESICGGCGEFRTFLNAEIFLGGEKKTIFFDSCRGCLLTRENLQKLFLREVDLPTGTPMIFAVSIEELIAKNGKIACCRGSDAFPDSSIAQLPRVVSLDVGGYLYPCSNCKTIYFEAFAENRRAN